jgi:hypothetical protein
MSQKFRDNQVLVLTRLIKAEDYISTAEIVNYVKLRESSTADSLGPLWWTIS